MPELRKDPVVGRWVIVATERAARPKDFKHATPGDQKISDCHFCKGKEDPTTEELFVLREDQQQDNWYVKVIRNKNPFLAPTGELWRKGKGLYDLINAVGVHEIVIECPNHVGNMADLERDQIERVLYTYIQRMKLYKDDKHLKYLMVFKNYGVEAGGGRVPHSRSQIIGTPVNLKRVKEELENAKTYFAYHDRCLFCDVIRQEREQNERVVAENKDMIAICPFASRFPYEVWIFPKRHHCDFYTIDDDERRSCATILKEVLLRQKLLLSDPPYNYVIHTAPFRRVSHSHKKYWTTIEEDFHWHREITPRLTKVAGFEWGTGFYICTTAPESAAKFLKEVEIPQ